MVANAESCYASWGDPPGGVLDCELPAGHEGQHQATAEWDEAPPILPVARALEDMTGYDFYLAAKFAGTTLTEAGADLSTIDPSLRCLDTRCTLPAGHSGLHEDAVSRWTQPIPLQRGPFDAR